jgi:DNA-binding MarR family transcriptional regulator
MRESRLSVERWDLTLPQFDVLAELGRATRGGFTFGELSRMLLVTSGNLTGIVDRLESEGLVRREKGKRDRRVVRIVLTRKGRRLVDQIAPLHARDIEAVLAFMSEQQLEALNDLLGALRDGLRDRWPSVRQTRRAATSHRSDSRSRSTPSGLDKPGTKRVVLPMLKEAARKADA